MAGQGRAEATRQTIINAAVDLFMDIGYGNTAIKDIIGGAEVTNGAFYYHFPTKESLASTIIENAETRIQDLVLRITLSSSSPALENLIRSHFAVADMTQYDRLVRVGNLLRQALNQVSPAGPLTYMDRRAVMISAVKSAIAERDLRDDIDAEEVAHACWAAGLGNRLLSDATGADVFTGLGQAWRVILRGIITAHSRAHYQQFVTSMANDYSRPAQSPDLPAPVSPPGLANSQGVPRAHAR